MAPTRSPVVAHWELALRLRERRERLGMSVTEIAKRLGFTHNYWSAIEYERKLIPVQTLETTCDVLEFDARERRELLDLREAAKGTGWWNDYSALFDGDIRRLFGLEHGARQIRGYESLLIPGLLQTAGYARAIIDATTAIPPVEIEQRVEVRLSRQKRLGDADPLDLIAIFSEAALRQQIGGATVLREQLDHLLEMIGQHPNVQIHVIPFTATACNLFGSGTLHLLDFQSPRLPRIAWYETVSDWGVIADPDKIRNMSMAFDQTLSRALDQRASKKVIERYRKEFR